MARVPDGDYNGRMGSPFAGALREIRVRRNLSQLELAQRASTTQRYVSFLESGRSVPGREMVIRLAESLELPLRARNDLLLASGYAPVYPESGVQDPVLRPVMGALQHVLDGHMPFPAIVVDRRGTLVVANDALAVLAEDVSRQLLVPPINAYRLALHPSGIAPRIRNLAVWGRHIIDRIRQDARRHPDPALDRLLVELVQYLPEHSPEPGSGSLGFAVPLEFGSAHGELRLITTITTFGTATDVTLAELRLEAFLPADEDTSRILTQLDVRNGTYDAPNSPAGRSAASA